MRLFLFSPLFSVFAVTLVLLFSSSSYALSSYTTNVIHGSAPYLTFDEGQTKVTDTNHLLAIRLSDGRLFTNESNNSTATNPIVLTNLGESFADIKMFIPTNTNSIRLNTLIGAPYNYWRDDDGDGQGSNGISATGNLTLTIVDNKNQVVARNHVLNICEAPYKVTITSTDGLINTQYGVPNRSTFSASNATYYISPKAMPTICFAKPELKSGTGIYAGPKSIWDPERGFLVQSTTPSSYARNFPTTGANGLYFDLSIGGSYEPLSWSVTNSGSGISADVKYLNESDTSVVRVTLTGPFAIDEKILVPSLPQTFELIGKDSHDNEVVKYGFQIKKWFINRGNVKAKNGDQRSWCKKIGYRLVQVKDLTNASCRGKNADDRCVGAVGATPLSPNNYSQRIINAGFFSEWGDMIKYDGANFFNDYYWTDDTKTNGVYTGIFVVFPDDGDIHYRAFGKKTYAVCVTP